jgi:hypothetical protein
LVKERWKESFVERGERGEDAERHVDQLEYKKLSSGRFYRPGKALDSGQEDTLEHVFQIPRSVPYDLLHVDLQITYMRRDRGRIDVEDFRKPHASWIKGSPYYCHPALCGERLKYHGRVHHNNNLVNVTHRPRYLTAEWSPTEGPLYSISSFYDFKSGRGSGDLAEERSEEDSFGVSTVDASSEVSVAELLKSIPSPRPS